MQQKIAFGDSIARLGAPLAWLAVAALLIAGCRPAGDDLVTTRLFVMATVVDLSLPQSSIEQEPDLIGKIEAELRQIERDYYAWGDGELAALNLALTGFQAFEASSDLVSLLQRSQFIASVTGGAFDPSVGALVELWGFHSSEQSDAEPPEDDEIAMVLERMGSITSLVVSPINNTVSPIVDFIPGEDRPVERVFTLDLGGIAKGAAVDRIVERLEAQAVTPALINAGGDLRVIGEPAGRSWRIGIQAPREDGMLGTIELRHGEAAFTSGDYERYFEHDGDRLHHILDPRNGLPVGHTQAITVLAADGTTADAAATALFVAGPAEWRQMAEALGVDAALRVDASGQIEMTSAMRDRFRPSTQAGSDIIAAAD